MQREREGSEESMRIPDAPEITLAILRNARSEVRSQGMGSRAVRRKPRLAWDALVEVYGSEAILKERIQRLKATNPEGVSDLIELAEKYLSGWRPKEFGDD